jgi:uncharacterized protein YndB with AHSA1/START domain
MEKEIINIEALIQADINLVWDCYTQPAHITKWNFASDDWHCPLAENDLCVGGKYHVRMEAKDGSFGFDLEAIYKSMDLGKGFVYVMSDNRMVTISLTPHGDNTQVIIEFEAENVNSAELQRAGWQAILNNFKKHVETID